MNPPKKGEKTAVTGRSPREVAAGRQEIPSEPAAEDSKPVQFLEETSVRS